MDAQGNTGLDSSQRNEMPIQVSSEGSLAEVKVPYFSRFYTELVKTWGDEEEDAMAVGMSLVSFEASQKMEKSNVSRLDLNEQLQELEQIHRIESHWGCVFVWGPAPDPSDGNFMEAYLKRMATLGLAGDNENGLGLDSLQHEELEKIQKQRELLDELSGGVSRRNGLEVMVYITIACILLTHDLDLEDLVEQLQEILLKWL